MPHEEDATAIQRVVDNGPAFFLGRLQLCNFLGETVN
jgi:hypothetical protein